MDKQRQRQTQTQNHNLNMNDLKLRMTGLLVNLNAWNFDIQNYRMSRSESETVREAFRILNSLDEMMDVSDVLREWEQDKGVPDADTNND